MEIVERILSKLVGKEMDEKEMELVAGGAPVRCNPPKMATWGSSTEPKCDNPI